MIAANFAKLVENPALMLPPGPLVTLVDPAQILRFCFDTHCRCPGNHDYESTNLLALCQLTSQVTFIVSQRAADVILDRNLASPFYSYIYWTAASRFGSSLSATNFRATRL